MYENLRERLTKRGFVETESITNRVKYNSETGEKLDTENPSYRLELGSNIVRVERRSDFTDSEYGTYQSMHIMQNGYDEIHFNLDLINPQDGNEDYIITLIDLLLSQQATPA